MINDIIILLIGVCMGFFFGYIIGNDIGIYKTKKFYNSLDCIKKLK